MVRLFAIAAALMVASLLTALVADLLWLRWLTLALAVGIIGFFAFLRRGHSPNQGRLPLPGLQSQVEVHIDDQGIPHIYARTMGDLFRAQGFITARDRLFAMELTRRAAAGRLAELLGEPLLPADRLMRTLGLRRHAEDEVASLDPISREALEAYAAGVNGYINSVGLPTEFTVLRLRPDPWTPADCLAVARYVACAHTASWPAALLRAELEQALEPEKVAELYWPPETAANLMDDAEASPEEIEELLQSALTALQEAGRFLPWTPARSGGTAWAVSGARTTSGKPLLAADLMQPPTASTRWYHIHLVGPEGLDVTGASVPGMPGVLFGRNRALAWGLAGQVRQPNCLRLHHRRSATDDELIQEHIRVRGREESVVHEVLLTRSGPAIARSDSIALTLDWSALSFDGAVDTMLAINRAQSWPEFQTALERYQGPPGVLMVACRDGTTARIRVGADAPAVVENPEDGYFLPEAEEFSPSGYRAQRAAERFHGATEMTAEKLRLFQADTVNLRARTLLKPLLTAVQTGLRTGAHPESLNDVEKRALLMLSGWNGAEEADGPQAALWHLWFQFLTEEIFRPQMGRALFDRFTAFGRPDEQTDRLIRAVTAGETSQWFTPEGEGSLPRTCLRAYRRAVALLAAKQGSRPDRWRWGREHQVNFPHPLSPQAKFARFFLGHGPYPVGGSGLTVNARGYDPNSPFQVTLAATWRQVVDLSDPEGLWIALAPGQSDHPLSANFGDLVGPWLKGEFQQAHYRHGAIRQMHSLTLLP